MSARRLDPRWKAALVATLLFGLGAVAGVAADRVWLRNVPTATAVEPLTAEALSTALDLDPQAGARVRSVLDSLQGDVRRALEAGPDSLRAVARQGRRRLEDALPPDRRAGFQEWMQRHHSEMMERMGGTMGGANAMGPSMMATDSGRGGMMDRGGRMMRPDTGGAKR